MHRVHVVDYKDEKNVRLSLMGLNVPNETIEQVMEMKKQKYQQDFNIFGLPDFNGDSVSIQIKL